MLPGYRTISGRAGEVEVSTGLKLEEKMMRFVLLSGSGVVKVECHVGVGVMM